MQNDLNRAHQAVRWGTMWKRDGSFDRALATLQRFPGAADEIALFTSDTHAPLSLETLKERTDALAPCIEKARAAGFRCGINHLALIGHHEEYCAGNLKDADFSVDIDGNRHIGDLCMSSPRTLSYVRESVKILLSANPDFIWLDDDLRFYHNGIRCFCDNCLSVFEGNTGVKMTREGLKAAFANSDADSLHIRELWRQNNKKIFTDLFRAVREAADEVDPHAVIGSMSCEYIIEGYPYAECADILSHGGKIKTKWRPGGGAYTDDRLNDFITKAHVLGRQCAALPDYVTDVQSEVENFPYQYLSKGATANMMESLIYIAAGCTGTAFNITPFYGEPLATIEPTLKKAAELRPFFDRLVSVLGRERPIGIGTGWTDRTFFSQPALCDVWGLNLLHTEPMHAIGLPPAYDTESTCLFALSDESVRGLSDSQLKNILSGAVYCDAATVEELEKRGFSEFVGFTIDGCFPQDMMERYCEHPLNGDSAGQRRCCRQSFTPIPAYSFIPHKGAEILCELVDFDGKKHADCCMGIFENSLGGRVCVSGYFPYSMLCEYGKTTQLKSVFSRLTGDGLPAFVQSFHRANIWARRLPDGRTAAVLLNAGLDPTQDLTLCVNEKHHSARFFSAERTVSEPDGRTLTPSDQKEKQTCFTLPELGPWEVCLLICE